MATSCAVTNQNAVPATPAQKFVRAIVEVISNTITLTKCKCNIL